ncbi:u5 snrnp complex subunit [Moniliophthora roreri MCA 2997]|uniref:U5 snrnp complex subunit n=2 Tax=Moniliophthora roreri TaxID=221103 RepID=V2YCR5_MONRO|nr:u5 snrnp complex subunit [Moniliophthora roreri MCA 2997]KAI3611647.1 u5 snrnp complex subunit [Moniliophthora roreri]
MSKRSSSPPGAGQLVKRQRATPEPQNQIAISSSGKAGEKGLIRTVQRTSGLESPIVSLAGAHSGEILSTRFSPDGQSVASASADRSVSMWRTYPPNTNYALLQNLHKAAITDLQWSLTEPLIYTVSADHMLVFTDTKDGSRVRKIRAHKEIINTLDRTLVGGGQELLATGSDDGTVRIWEGGYEGSKEKVGEITVGCPVTAVKFSAGGDQIFVGALDNLIHVYDIRSYQEQYALSGHTDTPTSLSVSPDGNYLLSPSLSSITLIHDIRPFSALPNRIYRSLYGAPAGFENTLLRGAWSKDDGGKRVAVGGADRMVCVWEVESGRVEYKLPGHKGTVTAVDFHPREPILLTASKDGTMILGEIESKA